MNKNNDYAARLSNMNKQNMLRHIVSHAKKIIKTGRGDLKEMKTLIHMATNYNAIHCNYCDEEDFGLCGLRDIDITDEEKHTKYCLPALLKYMENKYKI